MTEQSVEKNLFQRNAQKIIALFFWLALIVSYQWYASVNDLSPLQVVQRMLVFMQNGVWGVLIYVILYAVRPLILFPATVLTLAGGFVFGPFLGVLYTIIAGNISSTIAFYVGQFFGDDILKDDGSNGIIQRYTRRMRENSFETVMVMRFIFLPYDAVSYLAGIFENKICPIYFSNCPWLHPRDSRFYRLWRLD